MTIQPNQSLLHYRVVEKLGEGGMGVVWRAIDGKLDREVAIKVLPADLAEDTERLARFEREAKLLASLNQRNIASIYGIEHAEGLHFIVMELVEGEDLAVRLGRSPLSVDDAVDVCCQIARALEAAHDNGVVHRDLKPANVMIDDESRIKVLDFGLAKAFEAEPAEGRRSPSLSPTITSAGTRDGVILGTSSYMSPEQARGRAVDKRSDLWSFGCVLFECLTGRQVFKGETVTDTLAAVLKVDPDWTTLPADTPPRVRELLERCLAKNLKNRMRDAGDVRLELERVAAGQGESTDASGRVALASTATPQRRRASVPALLAAAVVGAAIGIGLWGWLTGFGSAPAPRQAAPVTRLTMSYPKQWRVAGVTISPDGRTLAVRAFPRNPETLEQDFSRLYLRSLDSDEPTVVEGSDRVWNGAFSPDSRWLVMLARPDPDSNESQLIKVAVDGSSPPQPLLDWPGDFVAPLHWLPDGDLVAGTDRREVVRIPSDGSAPREPVKIWATEFEDAFEFSRIAGHLLPDGIHILGNVQSYGERGWVANLGVLNVDTGEGKVILEDGANPRWSPTGHLLFSRGETILAVAFDPETLETTGGAVAVSGGLRTTASWAHGWFDVSRDGTLVHFPGGLIGRDRQIFWVDAEFDEMSPWSDDRRPFEPEWLIASPDGRRLALVLTGSDDVFDTWISEVERPNLRLFADEKGMDCTPSVWTPDGERLVYACEDNNVGRFFVKSADPGDPPRLLFEESSEAIEYRASTVTADGSSLILTSVEGPERNLLTIPLASAGEVMATPTPLLPDASDPRISPDGRWLAYESEATGRWEVYLRRFRSDGSLGPEIRVSTDGGADPYWYTPELGARPLIRYWATGGLHRVRLTTEPELRVDKPEPVPWFQEKREFYRNFSTGSPMPDGRHLMLRKGEDEAEPTGLSVVLNWTAELERRLGR